MPLNRLIILGSLFMILASSAPALAPGPTLYDRVAALLRERYYDKKFCAEQLPPLIEKYRPRAGSPSDAKGQRLAAEKLLSHIPASHLGLLSEESYHYLMAELSGQPRPTIGFQVVRLGDQYFTFFVLEGGPAAMAGVTQGERVVSLDGAPVAESPRLDWAQKDAFLPVDRDPPIHSILCQSDEEITAVLERTPGQERTVKLKARPYSSWQAARTSARLLELEGRKVGYVHFWFIHSAGVPELLRELFAGEFSKAEGLLLDLRGRGGNGVAVPEILRVLSEWGKPMVALTDRQSRSAKDALAYEFKERRLATLVGEQTAGAVIPASFAPVGEKTILMFPSFTLGEYTRKLELKGGVRPDVFVERSGPYANGHDPIYDRAAQELVRRLKDASGQASAPPTVGADSTPAAPSPSLPLPTDIPALPDLIRKMANALGGEKAIRSRSHRTLSGTTEMIGLPLKGPYLQKASAPNKTLVEMHLGDLLVRQGFDGWVAWTDSTMTGKTIVTGPAADMIRQQAQFYGPLDLVTGNREVSVAGFSIFDGKPCLEIKLIGQGGGSSLLYVDAQTYLPAGTKMMIETPIGMVETKIYSRNYRDLGGLITATEISIDSSVQRQLIKIEKASFEEIPASEYAPPLATK